MSDEAVGARPIVVIGAGAAGTMAAIFAARAGRAVTLLERTRDGGRKILISGGGRCNVLPSEMSPSQYFTASSPNTLKKILLSWPLEAQKRFFEEDLRIPLVREETGKLFPVSNRARDVRDGLLDHAASQGARLRFETLVTGLAPSGRGWRVEIDGADPIDAAAVVIATGGLSVPQTGSEGLGLKLARRLGHTVHETYPALTPLTADPHPHVSLAGISLEVELTAPLPRGELRAKGGFLITHRGYSGPSVLDVSHLAVLSRATGSARQEILVKWSELDAAGWETLFKAGGDAAVFTLLKRRLPDRLASMLLAEAGVAENRALGQLRREERLRLVDALTRYPLPWTGDEGYRKAEVTGGGVALSEVDPRTLESRRHSGLYFCGEVLDAFGPIGGYNFAWAWATGRAAGIGAASTPETSENEK